MEIKNEVGVRAHNWLVTMFPSQDEFERGCQHALVELLAEECTYAVIGYECCPKTGRLHWHVYLRYPKLVEGRWIQDRLGGKWHLDVSNRGATRAAAYVKKGGCWKEWGVKPEPRSRDGDDDGTWSVAGHPDGMPFGAALLERCMEKGSVDWFEY